MNRDYADRSALAIAAIVVGIAAYQLFANHPITGVLLILAFLAIIVGRP